MLSTWRYIVNPFNFLGAVVAMAAERSRAKKTRSLHFLDYPEITGKRIRASSNDKIRIRLRGVQIINKEALEHGLGAIERQGEISEPFSRADDSKYTVEFEIDKNVTLGELNFSDLSSLANGSLRVFQEKKGRLKALNEAQDSEVINGITSTLKTYYRFSDKMPDSLVNEALSHYFSIKPGVVTSKMLTQGYYNNLAKIDRLKGKPELLKNYAEGVDTALTIDVLDSALRKHALENAVVGDQDNLEEINQRKFLLRILLGVLVAIGAVAVLFAAGFLFEALAGVTAISSVFNLIVAGVVKSISWLTGFIIPRIVIPEASSVRSAVSFISGLFTAILTSSMVYISSGIALVFGAIGVLLTRAYKAYKTERLDIIKDRLELTSRELEEAKAKQKLFRTKVFCKVNGSDHEPDPHRLDEFLAARNDIINKLADLSDFRTTRLIGTSLNELLALNPNIRILNLAGRNLSYDELLEVFNKVANYPILTINLSANQGFTDALTHPENHKDWWAKMINTISKQPYLKRIYFDEIPPYQPNSLQGKLQQALVGSLPKPKLDFETNYLSHLNARQLEIVKPFFKELAINRVMTGEMLSGELERLLFGEDNLKNSQVALVSAKLEPNSTLTQPLEVSYQIAGGHFNSKEQPLFYQQEIDEKAKNNEVTNLVNRIIRRNLQGGFSTSLAASQMQEAAIDPQFQTDFISLSLDSSNEQIKQALGERYSESSDFKERLACYLAVKIMQREGDSQIIQQIKNAAIEAINHRKIFTFDAKWVSDSDAEWFLDSLSEVAKETKAQNTNLSAKELLKWLDAFDNSSNKIKVSKMFARILTNIEPEATKILLKEFIESHLNEVGLLVVTALGGKEKIFRIIQSVLEYGYENSLLIKVLKRPLFLNNVEATLDFLQDVRSFSRMHPGSELERQIAPFTEDRLSHVLDDLYAIKAGSNNLIELETVISKLLKNELSYINAAGDKKIELQQALKVYLELNESATSLERYKSMSKIYQLVNEILGPAPLAKVLIESMESMTLKMPLDLFNLYISLFFQDKPNVLNHIAAQARLKCGGNLEAKNLAYYQALVNAKYPKIALESDVRRNNEESESEVNNQDLSENAAHRPFVPRY